MTPLPGPLADGEIVGWRIDIAEYADAWDSGEGAFRVGGRWNNPGTRAVYAAFDPSTAILEVAVHKGFEALDLVPHVLTSFTIKTPSSVHIVQPAEVPDKSWLHPTMPGPAQRRFGEDRLKRHHFVAIPSAVSSQSWNLVFNPLAAKGAYTLRSQERLAIDPRLSPGKH